MKARYETLENELHTLSILIFILWIGLFVVFTGRLERESAAEQKEALELALERDITTCYALEGQFPPDLAYLERPLWLGLR